MDHSLFGPSFYELTFYTAAFLSVIVVVYKFWVILLFLTLAFLSIKLIKWKLKKGIEINGQGVLITGCDTGFGHFLACRLDEMGFTVFAGVLNTENEGALRLHNRRSKRLHVVQLNVTKEEDIQQAFTYVSQQDTGLWGVVNNAGVNFPGDVELLTLDQYKEVAEINLYGGIRVLKTFLPMIRNSKGRVVNITSARGLYSWPGESAYIITKHGMETVSDCLRLEMRKFGVKVCVVQPGDYDGATSIMSATHLIRIKNEIENMWENADEEVRMWYGKRYFDEMYNTRVKRMTGIKPHSPEPVLDAIVDALINTSPPTRSLVDGTSGYVDFINIFAMLYNLLPESVTDWMAMYWSGY